jgi:hypothetical protein
VLIKNADALAVYPRARFRNSRTWNSFVDRHPNGAWWHRQEWIDYSLAYDPSLVDRSFAIVSEGMNYPQVVAICPALERNGLICMGDDPCAGPLVTEHPGLSGVRLRWCRETLLEAIRSRLAGMECWWRWNRSPCDYRNTIAEVAETFGMKYSCFPTAVVPLWGDPALTDVAHTMTSSVLSSESSMLMQWLAIRSSYRSLIKKAARDYDIGYGFDNLWAHYESCHRQCATRPRPGDTYLQQFRWLRNNDALVIVALPSGGTEGAMAEDGRVTSPLSWPAVGSSPASSTTLSAAYINIYKGQGYYASGPSVQTNLQHALQWAAMQALSKMRCASYEIGWIKGDDGISFFKSGFGGEMKFVDVLSGVV